MTMEIAIGHGEKRFVSDYMPLYSMLYLLYMSTSFDVTAALLTR